MNAIIHVEFNAHGHDQAFRRGVEFPTLPEVGDHVMVPDAVGSAAPTRVAMRVMPTAEDRALGGLLIVVEPPTKDIDKRIAGLIQQGFSRAATLLSRSDRAA